jgi:hypothetical protein
MLPAPSVPGRLPTLVALATPSIADVDTPGIGMGVDDTLVIGVITDTTPPAIGTPESPGAPIPPVADATVFAGFKAFKGFTVFIGIAVICGGPPMLCIIGIAPFTTPFIALL